MSTSGAYQYATGEGGIGLDAMNKNIRDFFATNPTEEATRAAMAEYGLHAMTQIYDPRNMEWSYWNALIAEKYEAQQLMWPVAEENWKDFALSICSIALFSNYGVPTPHGFDRWQDWAFAFNNAVN